MAGSMPLFQESSGLWVASLWMKQGTQDEQEKVGAVAGARED